MKTISFASTLKFRILISLACMFFSFSLQAQEATGYRIKGSGEVVNPNQKSAPQPVALPTTPAFPSTPLSPLPRPLLDSEAIEKALSAQPQNDFINHEVFKSVLNKYVNKAGWVDYRGLSRDSEAKDKLKAYINDLSELNPMSLADPRDRAATWLNLYNALIIQEILKHYPVKSLLEIKDYFGAKRFKIAGVDYSILALEEDVFRQEIKDPRMVFARVNGSSAGPRMLREPFDAAHLDEQLEERTWKFLTDPANVQYDKKRNMLSLSSLFLWYEKDFVDIPAFLTAYLNLLPNRYQISFKGYDFQLNDEKLH